MKPAPLIILIAIDLVLIALLIGIIIATVGKGYNIVAFTACVVLGFPIIWIADDIRKRM